MARKCRPNGLMVDKMCGRDNANVQNSNKKDGGGDCEQEQKSKFRLGMA